MPPTPLDLENEFRNVLPAESVRHATPGDVVGGLRPRFVLEPTSEQQLAAALALANDAGLAVIPRGAGTKLRWGNSPARADLILSTARLNKIIEHAWADLTVSVEAGCNVGALQAALAQHGQRLAIDPLWPETATVGGILSANDSGSLRLRFGSIRDLIIGATIALADGTLASSGGKVVKNVAGYDLPKLVTGAFGTLGVVTRAVFRLHPSPHNSRTLSISGGSVEKAQEFLLRVQDSNLAHTSLQLRVAEKSDPIVDILFEGTEEGIAAQIARAKSLGGIDAVRETSREVWKATQELWTDANSPAIAKITLLPADVARTVGTIQRVTSERKTKWGLVMQAIGTGSLRLDGPPEALRASLSEIRSQLEIEGGALVVRQRPSGMPAIDAWGKPGDALALMQAIKKQFDPRNTLSPGCFVGGI
jgi:glycolate oxidase FAD binding subunit